MLEDVLLSLPFLAEVSLRGLLDVEVWSEEVCGVGW